MQKVINVLFAVAIVLAACLAFFGLSGAHADTEKAMDVLRKTTLLVRGDYCSGSGSIVKGKSGKKYLLTNAHVCNCAKYKNYVNATYSTGELVKAKFLKLDWRFDLCASSVDKSYEALELGSVLLPFTEVNTRGFPHGQLAESHGTTAGNAIWGTDFAIEEVGTCPSSSRVIKGFNGNVAACELEYMSTLTNLYGRPGSSGSAVVNDEGQLVGVISSWHPDSDYDAGMVPFSQLEEFLNTL